MTAATDSIAWNKSKFTAVLEKDISSCLRRVDSDTIVGDDCRSCWWNAEFFSGKFEHSCERRIFGNWKAENEKVVREIFAVKLRLWTYTLYGSFESEVKVILNVTLQKRNT